MRTTGRAPARRSARRAAPIALFAALALFLAACGGVGPVDRNEPYEPDTPAPAPHEGTFVSAHGTMTFSGDGQTVALSFDDDLAGRLGLPAGEHEASYAFRSGYMPPHGYVDVRYDTAMTFWMTVGETTAMAEIGQYQDGQFYTGTNCTTADRITFFVDRADGGGREPIDFLKQ